MICRRSTHCEALGPEEDTYIEPAPALFGIPLQGPTYLPQTKRGSRLVGCVVSPQLRIYTVRLRLVLELQTDLYEGTVNKGEQVANKATHQRSRCWIRL